MIKINVKIDPARIRQAVKALGDITPGIQVAGRGVRNLAVQHFRTLNAEEPNKLGGKRTNFWANVGRSVLQPRPVNLNTIQIDVTHPAFRQKYLGGTIRPKLRKWLALPANALAYGKSPRSFNLSFVKLGPDKAMLVRKDAMKKPVRFKTQGRTEKGTVTFEQRVKLGAGAVMFWLVKKVIQKPHNHPFPLQGDMETVARTTFDAWLRRALGEIGKS